MSPCELGCAPHMTQDNVRTHAELTPPHFDLASTTILNSSLGILIFGFGLCPAFPPSLYLSKDCVSLGYTFEHSTVRTSRCRNSSLRVARSSTIEKEGKVARFCVVPKYQVRAATTKERRLRHQYHHPAVPVDIISWS